MLYYLFKGTLIYLYMLFICLYAFETYYYYVNNV